MAGASAAPSPLHPHPLLFFNGLPLLPTLFPFFILIIGYLGSYYLYWYPSPLVPMCFFLGMHCGGRRCALLPSAPPHPLLFFNGPPLLPTFFFFISIIGYLGSFYLYWYPSPLVPMYFFLGTHCGGRRCALPPAPLHPLLFFNRFPLLPALFPFFHKHRFFGWMFSFSICIYIHRDLSLCASFLVCVAGGGAAPSPLPHPFFFLGLPLLPTLFPFFISIIGYLGSFYLCWCPSPLVPMCFFLGAHCGGRRCALPPAPPHPLLFFNGLPLLPTLFPFFISIIGYLGSFYLYWYPSPLVPMCFFLGTHCDFLPLFCYGRWGVFLASMRACT